MAKKKQVTDMFQEGPALDKFLTENVDVIDTEDSKELDAVLEPTYEVIKAFKADLYGVKYDCQPGDVISLDDICYRKLKDNLK